MKNHYLSILATFCLAVFILFMGVPSAVKYLKTLHDKQIVKELEQEKEVEEEYKNKERVYLAGHFDPATRGGFILLPKEYSANLYPVYLREETYGAYVKMYQAAKEDDIILHISSGTRNFDSQKYLWDEKWKALGSMEEQKKFRKILEYV